MKNVVFMGSPDFAVPVLLQLAEKYFLKGVVTQPDRPAGRGRTMQPCPVKASALELGLEILQPERLLHNQSALQQLEQWSPEVIVVAAYGKILRSEILELPPMGCINVHASLLPRWRGASPIQASIYHGDAYSGVTIMKMDEGLDTGPILSQKSIEIRGDETAGTLEKQLSVLGADLLLDTLPGYLDGSVKPRPQPEEGATYAPLLKKENGRLDFTKDAPALARQVRAYNPWPGCFTVVDGASFKIHRAYALNDTALPPGKMSVVSGYPAIGARGGCLVLTEVQPAGKKSMDGKTFLMGYRNWDHQVDDLP